MLLGEKGLNNNKKLTMEEFLNIINSSRKIYALGKQKNWSGYVRPSPIYLDQAIKIPLTPIVINN